MRVCKELCDSIQPFAGILSQTIHRHGAVANGTAEALFSMLVPSVVLMATEKVIRSSEFDVPVTPVNVEHEMTNFAATAADSQANACGCAIWRRKSEIVCAIWE